MPESFLIGALGIFFAACSRAFAAIVTIGNSRGQAGELSEKPELAEGL
jgi:hypothetical protein